MKSDNDNSVTFEQKVVFYKDFPLLDEMRREGKFCDVTVKVEGLSLGAHKIVLSATIPYFHAMFTSNMLESETSEVTLQEIEAKCLEALINFSYTGKIVINIETVQSLMLGASYLQLTAVLDACEDFLCKRLKVSSVIGTKKFATTMSYKRLVNACKQFIEMHFSEVSSCDELLDVSAEELGHILSSNQLNVYKEEEVFMTLMKWIEKDSESRKKHLPQLLSKIRLPLISLEYLVDNIAKIEVIKSSFECRNLIDEVKDYHLLDKRCVLENFKSDPRWCELLTGFIFVVGGLDDQFRALATVELYSPLDCKWSLTTPMLTSRAKVAVAVVDDCLYAIGGEHNYQGLNKVEMFNFTTKEWMEISPMKSKRSAGGAAALANKVYVCGGFDGICSLNSVESYDPESDNWTLTQPMITRRSSCGVVALDDYLYALGGHNDETVLNLVERYDPETKTWTEVAPMLTKRCRLGVASLEGKLYACGGFDGSSFLKTVEMYDPKDDIWQMIAPMNTKRSRVALVVNMGKLWAIGGYNGKSVLSTVEIYNPFLNNWTFGPPMTESGGGVGVGVIYYSNFKKNNFQKFLYW